MPLFLQNRQIDRVSSTSELFSKHSHLQENARVFRSKTPTTVDPKCLLYVQQREFAATIPLDRSGATCLAHCDGSRTWSEVPLIVKAVTSLTGAVKDGRYELHLVGGFDDESQTSHKLSLSLLAAFQKQQEEIHLETCCITEMNDEVVEGVHRPVVYGIGVNVKTGEVFPASFPTRGPAEDLRSARTFTGGQMVEIYDSSKEQVEIGPCKWTPNRDIAFWLAQDDDTILQYLSTSPMAEPPHFVQHIKSTIQFLLNHPTADSLFPGGQPQVFRRTQQGGWDCSPPPSPQQQQQQQQ
ncbi:protein N-terminal asparagine amidohydrolase isoform X2 [Alosa alosa]|uniref:protein N-terminal asparagine amidohydrolase isoform X2 n=1 Tax=Alosa alosa TaxID=278164 RepID=UPI0020152D43|nr:protein N-terminal asparagine amidohydrolase isoform X2 [Alosa alosa]